MSFISTFALVLILIIRPQEIWPALTALRLLDVFTALAVIGVLVDFATGKRRYSYSPQLPFLAGFIISCYASTVLVVGREGLGLATARGLIPAIFMLSVMYGATTFARLRSIVVLLLAITAFVSVVAVHQGQVEPVCMELVTDEAGEIQPDITTADGRSCTTGHLCSKDAPRVDVDYACERIGLFNTVSTGRRVRWRGQLGDPNELSVFIGAVLPFLFALGMAADRKLRSLFSLLLLGVGLYAVILSQSRGGQLVVGTVFAIYFVMRFGAKGLVGAALLALPVVLLGGRDDVTAESSSEERVGLLYEGVNLVVQHPIIGVGIDQFKEHLRSHMTAHNSYLLAAAELGFPGFFFWSGLVWTSLKIPFKLARWPGLAPDAVLRRFAVALVVSFVGMAIGIFFLSFTYKQLLFVWFGIAGALYTIVKAEEPSFEVTVGARDFLGIVLVDVVLLTLIFGYSRLKGAG